MEDRLYKIGEVCRVADVQPYVLRYWETEFPPLAPNKSGGGQRMYTRREIDIILRIKELLYSEGFTIAGAKKKLEVELNAPASEKSGDAHPNPANNLGEASEAPYVQALLDVKRELAEILALLSDDQPKSATIRSRPARSSSSKASS